MKQVLLLLSLITFSQFSSANSLDRFLNDTTWCFEDTAGDFDHGRLRFHYEPWGFNTGFYDVTDAPGTGGQDIYWVTDSIFGYRIRLTMGTKGNYYLVYARVQKQDQNHMLWTWTHLGTTSRLHRCG